MTKRRMQVDPPLERFVHRVVVPALVDRWLGEFRPRREIEHKARRDGRIASSGTKGLP